VRKSRDHEPGQLPTSGQARLGRDGFPPASRPTNNLEIRCISQLEEVLVIGEVAYTRCRDSLSVTRRVGGEATEPAMALCRRLI
jgi:hypothetical protein